jgi:hypothetical protein
MSGPRSKDDAQRRADQIAAFRAELVELEREGAVLDSRQLETIAARQDAIPTGAGPPLRHGSRRPRKAYVHGRERPGLEPFEAEVRYGRNCEPWVTAVR